MICEHASRSPVWTIKHGLNTSTLGVECWVDMDGDTIKILPVSIIPKDSNTVEITFMKPYAGYVDVVQQKLWSDR